MTMRAPLPLCVSVLALASVAACAVAPPSSPSIAAMPGPGKSFEAFNRDDAVCRNWAYDRSGGASVQQQQNNQVGTAVAGTAIGAAAGALLGAGGGNAGGGAAVGAGLGLLGGSAIAANQTQYGAYGAQQNFDIAYAQCMSAKGNRVPDPQAYGGPRGPYDDGPEPPPP